MIDLIKQIAHAETRPLGVSFPVGEHTFGGRSRTSIIAPAASRIIWTLPIPHRASLRVHVGVPGDEGPASVAVRIGISDERIYEALTERMVTSEETARHGWIPIAADLSAYAGRKLSLFYRPDRRRWRVILGTTVISGSPALVYLGEPGIDTDIEGAREYSRRRTSALH